MMPARVVWQTEGALAPEKAAAFLSTTVDQATLRATPVGKVHSVYLTQEVIA